MALFWKIMNCVVTLVKLNFMTKVIGFLLICIFTIGCRKDPAFIKKIPDPKNGFSGKKLQYISVKKYVQERDTRYNWTSSLALNCDSISLDYWATTFEFTFDNQILNNTNNKNLLPHLMDIGVDNPQLYWDTANDYSIFGDSKKDYFGDRYSISITKKGKYYYASSSTFTIYVGSSGGAEYTYYWVLKEN